MVGTALMRLCPPYRTFKGSLRRHRFGDIILVELVIDRRNR